MKKINVLLVVLVSIILSCNSKNDNNKTPEEFGETILTALIYKDVDIIKKYIPTEEDLIQIINDSGESESDKQEAIDYVSEIQEHITQEVLNCSILEDDKTDDNNLKEFEIIEITFEEGKSIDFEDEVSIMVLFKYNDKESTLYIQGIKSNRGYLLYNEFDFDNFY